VLGLAIDGIGDTVTVERAADGASRVGEVTGRDAGEIPREVATNCAAIAAREYLRRRGIALEVVVHIDKGLPLSGASAAAPRAAWRAPMRRTSSPGTSIATDRSRSSRRSSARDRRRCARRRPPRRRARRRDGGGRPHLDNIGPALFGGLVLSRSVDPIDVVPLRWGRPGGSRCGRRACASRRAPRAPSCRRTATARLGAADGEHAALVHAFASGDGELLGRALDDRYAEPRRAPLIPRFAEVEGGGARRGRVRWLDLGSGPTVFAVAQDEDTARAAAAAMQRAGEIDSTTHVGAIERQEPGAHERASGIRAARLLRHARDLRASGCSAASCARRYPARRRALHMRLRRPARRRAARDRP
jgi:homoserine kinase